MNPIHTGCNVTVEALPSSSLLKTGLNEGQETLASGSLRLRCEGPLALDCLLDLVGTEAEISGGEGGLLHTTSIGVLVPHLGTKHLCPDKVELDYLLATLSETFLLL
jgi:hypothetical protein